MGPKKSKNTLHKVKWENRENYNSIVYCTTKNCRDNSMDAKPVKPRASLSFVRRRIAGKLCPMYSHSPLYSVTYYVGRVEGEASVPRVVNHVMMMNN